MEDTYKHAIEKNPHVLDGLKERFKIYTIKNYGLVGSDKDGSDNRNIPNFWNVNMDHP